MEPNQPNQNNFPPHQQPSYSSSYQNPILFNSSNQFYIAIPINQLRMLNGQFYPPSAY